MNERSQKKCLEQKLVEKLKSFESPFQWMLNRFSLEFGDISSKYILDNCETNSDDSNFSIYTKHMRRLFELVNLGYFQSAVQAMDEWEKFFYKTEASERFFSKYKSVFQHVLHSSKAFLLFKMQEYNQVEELIESIEKLNDDTASAGISGLKAEFFCGYTNTGCLEALPHAQKALELDPTEPEWIKLTATTMRNIRRRKIIGTKESRDTELELFQKLLSIEVSGTHLIHLGIAYIDVGDYKDYEKKRVKQHKCYSKFMCEEICLKIKDDYFSKGVECFREAMAVDPRLNTYGQVLEGINTIPGFYRHLYREIADICVNKMIGGGEEGIIEDKRGYYMYYEISKYYDYLKKAKKALEYLNKSVGVGGRTAKKDLICKKYNEDRLYDPHGDIQELMDAYECGPMMVQCLCQLASYHLFKNDLLKVTDYVLKAIVHDPTFKYGYLMNLSSWFNGRRRLNLLKAVKNSVSSRLNELGSEDTSEEKQKLADFMEKLEKMAPEISFSGLNLNDN